MDLYKKSSDQVLSYFNVSKSGFSSDQVLKKQKEFGPNILKAKTGKNIVHILWSQISNFLIILLIISAIVSFALEGPNINTIVLIVVILLNIIMGFVQEYKAENALKALKSITPYKAIVRRNNIETKIPISQLVPGDIVLLKQGSKVPADVRIIKSSNLKIEESSLTGESIASSKNPKPISKTTPIADQENMAFMGTNIAYGHGEGIVTAIGNQTEFGKIAHLVQKKEEKTPLQKRLTYLGKILTLISVLLAILIFTLGLLRNVEIAPLFSYVIALLVSAVPESLPTITTLALALGIINIAKEKAIIRRLPVLESLASVNIICSDKTGTITKDEMTVKSIWLYDQKISITGKGYKPEGVFFQNNKKISPAYKPNLDQLIRIGDICNNAKLNYNQEKKKWEILGDPTEGALKVIAKKAKFAENYKKIMEFPFDFKLKRMSVLAESKNQKALYIKGAPSKLLEISKQIETPNGKIDIDTQIKRKIIQQANLMAGDGYRVLALGYRKISQISDKRDEMEKDIVFIGIVGMMDPPANGVQESLELARKAGIKTIIITGDHKLTTLKVAKQISLKINNDEVLEGQDLVKLSKNELENMVDKIRIYARTSPVQKIKIVEALQNQGNLVAVTGDGINDSPALKKANVGIAMGQRGTDVARESADMILTDDRFPTIISAIEYGRSIYDNIKKFFTFVLSGNFDELALVFLAFIVGLPQPFITIQILWINLVTDSFPAIALAFEKPSKGIMRKKPKDPSEGIMKPVLKKALFLGILGFAFELILFLANYQEDIVKARTLVFTFCVFFQLFIVFSIRSEKPFWKTNIFENTTLIWAVLLSAVLQIIVLYGPLQNAFQTTALNLVDWVLIVSGCLITFIIAEIAKVVKPPQFKS